MRNTPMRDTPMRDTPIYIGWRKGVAFVAGGGVEYGSAGLSRSTRRCTYAGKRRCRNFSKSSLPKTSGGRVMIN
jgi:hypothetical protein